MSEEQTRSVLLLALGATAVWLWHSGEALDYVRPGLAPLVLVAEVVLLARTRPRAGRSCRAAATASSRPWPPRSGARSRCRWPSSSPGRSATRGGRWPGCGCGWSGSWPRPRTGTAGYRLTRFVIFCCAADAEALQAVVRGDPVPRARDQWLEVEGTWQPRPVAVDDPSPPPPVLNADGVHPIAPARPPYEYSMRFSG